MFKNEHPDHLLNVRGVVVKHYYSHTVAECSCGWASPPADRRQKSEHAAGQHYAATAQRPAAGELRARCRLPRPVPFGQMTDAERERAPRTGGGEGIHSRWDRKLHLEVVDLPCDFETAEFETHMRELHADRMIRWDNASLDSAVREVRNYTPRVSIVKPWRAPKLSPDGKAWPDELEAGAYATKTCVCGLVVETRTYQPGWLDHLDACPLRSQHGDRAAS